MAETKKKTVKTKSTATKAKRKPTTKSTANTRSNRSKKSTNNSFSMERLMMGELVFGRENFMFVFIGLAVMIVGFLLMLGGAMPSPDIWEPERIYSFRRITLAPIFILAGLGIQIYAIFKNYESE